MAKILQTKMAIFIDAACGIMDLNQYIGSMNAKDCIYRNPTSLVMTFLTVYNVFLCDVGRVVTLFLSGTGARCWLFTFYLHRWVGLDVDIFRNLGWVGCFYDLFRWVMC